MQIMDRKNPSPKSARMGIHGTRHRIVMAVAVTVEQMENQGVFATGWVAVLHNFALFFS